MEITTQELQEFLELRKLIFSAIELNGLDGCKSYEGACSIKFPNYFEERYPESYPNELFGIHLDCYLIGPTRHYDWSGNTLHEAVEKATKDVKSWMEDDEWF